VKLIGRRVITSFSCFILGSCTLFFDSNLVAQQFKFSNLIPFRQQQTVEPIPLTDSQPKSFLQIPKINLFPQKSGDEVTILERIQLDSQQFFRNTGSNMSNWFDQTNQSLRMKTEQTWNFLNQSIPRPNWWAPKQAPSQMIHPPPRAAYDLKREAKIRF